MFRGLYTAKIDDKGRVSFPARFREVLASTGSDELFVTSFKSDGHPCLEAYPKEEWLKLEERLRQEASRSPRTIKYFQNVFLPGVQECQVDRQGRILLANRLRESAELGPEVVFVGLVDKLRIWSVDNFNVVNAASADLSEDPEVISLLGVT